jgi:hypothetical protein
MGRTPASSDGHGKKVHATWPFETQWQELQPSAELNITSDGYVFPL